MPTSKQQVGEKKKEFVKVFFPCNEPFKGCRGESMWIEVTKRKYRRIEGVLDNKPLFSMGHGYKLGDKVIAVTGSESPNTVYQAIKQPNIT